MKGWYGGLPEGDTGLCRQISGIPQGLVDEVDSDMWNAKAPWGTSLAETEGY